MALTQVTKDVLHNNQSNITVVGTLESLTVSGNATVGNVSATNLTGTLLTASQPNITSVGTLTNVTTSGEANVNSLSLTVTDGTIPDWGIWRFSDGAAIGIALVASGIDHIYLEEGVGTTFTQPTVASGNLTVNGIFRATNTIVGNISGNANNASFLGGIPAASYATTAYVQTAGQNSQGTKTVQSVSAGVPSNATGNNGDIIYQY